MPLLRELVERTAAWALIGTLSVGAVGAAFDVVLVANGHGGAVAALAIGAVTFSLTALVAVVGSPLVALGAIVIGRVARRRGVTRLLWPLAVLPGAWLVGFDLVSPTMQVHVDRYLGATHGFAVAMTALVVVTRWRRRWLASAMCIGVACAGLAGDLLLPEAQRDAQDLVRFGTVAAILAAASPLRSRLSAVPMRKVWLAVLAVFVAAGTWLAVVGGVASGWRSRAIRLARFEPSLARTCRALVDFDGDGASPVAWGRDCDDLDPRRHPLAHEDTLGLDLNCNGVTRPEHPTDDDRGLSPARGDALVVAGEIDRVVLVTIDSMRYDALTEQLVPSLWAAAQRGRTFERMYSAGAHTFGSLDLLLRTAPSGPTIATSLGRASIRSTAVLGYDPTDFHGADRADWMMSGFSTVRHPPEHSRWVAGVVTDAAIAELSAQPAGRHFTWVHYFDAHNPYTPLTTSIVLPALPMADAVRAYRQDLAYIDREVGRLLSWLDANGGSSRTVLLVASDHGEAFGEHGAKYHGGSGYETILHVPAFIVAPGIAPGRYSGLASHRDLGPTILGAFGIAGDGPEPAETYGRSLLRLRTAPDAPLHRFVFCRSGRGLRHNTVLSPLAVVVEDHYKLVVCPEDGVEEMYDLARDPGELTDVAAQEREAQARMRRDLELFRDIEAYP